MAGPSDCPPRTRTGRRAKVIRPATLDHDVLAAVTGVVVSVPFTRGTNRRSGTAAGSGDIGSVIATRSHGAALASIRPTEWDQMISDGGAQLHANFRVADCCTRWYRQCVSWRGRAARSVPNCRAAALADWGRRCLVLFVGRGEMLEAGGGRGRSEEAGSDAACRRERGVYGRIAGRFRFAALAASRSRRPTWSPLSRHDPNSEPRPVSVPARAWPTWPALNTAWSSE